MANDQNKQQTGAGLASGGNAGNVVPPATTEVAARKLTEEEQLAVNQSVKQGENTGVDALAPEPEKVDGQIVPDLPKDFGGKIKSAVSVPSVTAGAGDITYKPGEEAKLHAHLMKLDPEVRRNVFLELRGLKSLSGNAKVWVLQL